MATYLKRLLRIPIGNGKFLFSADDDLTCNAANDCCKEKFVSEHSRNDHVKNGVCKGKNFGPCLTPLYQDSDEPGNEHEEAPVACGQAFENKGAFVVHSNDLSIHDNYHPCNIEEDDEECDHVYIAPTHLGDHQREVHPDQDAVCPEKGCSKAFAGMSASARKTHGKNHARVKAGDANGMKTCTVCKKTKSATTFNANSQICIFCTRKEKGEVVRKLECFEEDTCPHFRRDGKRYSTKNQTAMNIHNYHHHGGAEPQKGHVCHDLKCRYLKQFKRKYCTPSKTEWEAHNRTHYSEVRVKDQFRNLPPLDQGKNDKGVGSSKGTGSSRS